MQSEREKHIERDKATCQKSWQLEDNEEASSKFSKKKQNCI